MTLDEWGAVLKGLGLRVVSWQEWTPGEWQATLWDVYLEARRIETGWAVSVKRRSDRRTMPRTVAIGRNADITKAVESALKLAADEGVTVERSSAP